EMYRLTSLLCCASGGTVRKKKPVRTPSVVIVVFVAEPETKPTPAFLRVGVVAFTSLLPAGPTTPRTFEPNDCAALTASALAPGPPRIVSPFWNLNFVLCVALYVLT